MKKFIEKMIFSNKWLLIIFYIGLYLAQMMYSYTYVLEVWHMMLHFRSITSSEAMVALLTVVDIVMVANLVKMIITGSYQVFIDKVPENTEKVSSGTLKVKMGTSLIGVTSIHLLETFISENHFTEQLAIKVGIHIVFLMSSLALAQIDFIHSRAEFYDARTELLLHKLTHKE